MLSTRVSARWLGQLQGLATARAAGGRGGGSSAAPAAPRQPVGCWQAQQRAAPSGIGRSCTSCCPLPPRLAGLPRPPPLFAPPAPSLRPRHSAQQPLHSCTPACPAPQVLGAHRLLRLLLPRGGGADRVCQRGGCWALLHDGHSCMLSLSLAVLRGCCARRGRRSRLPARRGTAAEMDGAVRDCASACTGRRRASLARPSPAPRPPAPAPRPRLPAPGAGLLPAAAAHGPAPRVPPVHHSDPRGYAWSAPPCAPLARACRCARGGPPCTCLPASACAAPSARTAAHLPPTGLRSSPPACQHARRARGLRDRPLHPLPRVAGGAGGAGAPPLRRAQHGAPGGCTLVSHRADAGTPCCPRSHPPASLTACPPVPTCPHRALMPRRCGTTTTTTATPATTSVCT